MNLSKEGICHSRRWRSRNLLELHARKDYQRQAFACRGCEFSVLKTKKEKLNRKKDEINHHKLTLIKPMSKLSWESFHWWLGRVSRMGMCSFHNPRVIYQNTALPSCRIRGQESPAQESRACTFVCTLAKFKLQNIVEAHAGWLLGVYLTGPNWIWLSRHQQEGIESDSNCSWEKEGEASCKYMCWFTFLAEILQNKKTMDIDLFGMSATTVILAQN